MSERTVTNLLDRYDELVATALADDDAAAGGPGRAGAGRSWRSTGCSRTSATRCCGWCATACRARSCWPGACCPRRPRATWPRCCARSPPRSACRSPAWSATASTRSAGRSRQALPGVPHQLCQFHYLREAAPADLRGRPPRQEGAEEAGPRRAPDRARGRGPRRPRGRGGARLLRGGARRDHRRRPAAAGGLGAAGSRAGSRRSSPASTGWRKRSYGGGPRPDPLDRGCHAQDGGNR